MMKDGDKQPYGQIVNSYVPEMWTKIKDLSQYEERKKIAKSFNKNSRWKKRGLSIIPTTYGISFPLNYLNGVGAYVTAYIDGSVLVSHGSVEMGQGINTKMAQIAANVFGIEMSKVHISEAASDKGANNSPPTAASVGADISGMAVLHACEQINDRLEPYRQKYPNDNFFQIISKAYKDRVSLAAYGYYKTPHGASYDWSMKTNENSLRGEMYNYFTQGIAATEVEIDVLSGSFRVIRSDVMMDLGKPLNPYVDIGQIEGSFVQGMGWCTVEELLWGDDRHNKWIKSGQLHSAGVGNYIIPSYYHCPSDLRVMLYDKSVNPRAIHSSKAIGEPALFLGCSVYFAIKDAIYSAREHNPNLKNSFFVLESPATCERIYNLCATLL
eukprot:TRINITY_DN6384_c0_g1_i2.p1 TRINITY_DN6384_c0_g1~~TRINITY_DN6384_c0_g1_i2.p1  ORF type:complete len:383 (-),score=86.88 TRINITY_DN6384_c0_g1_i2:82-1230(-)